MRHLYGRRNWEVADGKRGARPWLISIAAGFDSRGLPRVSRTLTYSENTRNAVQTLA
jgi:hypothetical protein